MVVCCHQAPAQEPAPAAAAAAQPEGFLELPVDETQRPKRSQVMQILRNRKFESGQEEIFDNYYKRYVLPRWTRRKDYEGLPNFRKELRIELLTGKSGPPHDRLNALALKYLDGMSRANVHPVVRFNAMLMIGDLNSKQPSGREPGVALPEALPILLKALEDEEQIEAAKVAAMIGIIRHSQMVIANEQARARVVAEMLKLAAAKNAPGRSADGHAWMRGQAVEALAALGAEEPSNSIAKILAAILAEPAAPLSLRCTAAWAIGQLKFQGAGAIDLPKMTNQLGGLAADICETEFKRLEEIVAEVMPKDDRRGAAPMMGMGMGMEGGGMGMEGGGMGMGMGAYGRKPPGVSLDKLNKASRRALMTRLGYVLHGLEALSRVASGSDQQPTIASLQKQIEELLTLLEDSDIDDYEIDDEDSLVNLLKGERAKFRALLSNEAKPKKPAPKKADDE